MNNVKRGILILIAISLTWTALGSTSATADSAATLTAQAVTVFPNGTSLDNTSLPAQGTNLTNPVSATVTLNGKKIWSTTFTKESFTDIPVPEKDMRAWPAGRAVLTLSSGNLTATARVHVHRGWVPLAQDRENRHLLASYPRCEALTWTYDDSAEPKGTKRVLADLRVVFKNYSSYTGLPLNYTSENADIVVSWEDLGQGADGIGGSRYTGTTYIDGLVKLNTQSEWARAPGFGKTGRGALLYHEVGHVFGLGHVNVPRTLMAPTHVIGYTNSKPGAFELRGLNFLYAPQTCS